jgi:hypothetical protein
MKKIKNLTAIILSAVMLIGVSACSTDPDEGSGDETTTTAPREVQPPGPPPSETRDENDLPIAPADFQVNVVLNNRNLTNDELRVLIADGSAAVTEDDVLEMTEDGVFITNVTNLSLLRNQISDLSVVIGLQELRALNLINNQVVDVSPLVGLQHLDTLLLAGNQITDVSPLTQVQGLKVLNLSNNQIADVSMLSSLTSLQTLLLVGNPIPEEQIAALQAALPNTTITV